MKGFYISNLGKLVTGVAPIDIGGAAKTADYWTMENYHKVTIIVSSGVITNDATITVFESEDNAGTNEAAIAFDYFAMDGAGNTGPRIAATAAGFATGTTNNRSWLIEIDAAQLTDGKPYMTVKTTAAAAHLITILPVLSGARYAQDNPPEPLT